MVNISYRIFLVLFTNNGFTDKQSLLVNAKKLFMIIAILFSFVWLPYFILSSCNYLQEQVEKLLL